jgi:hypothetical protein
MTRTGPRTGYIAAVNGDGWWVTGEQPILSDALPAGTPRDLLDTAATIGATQVWCYQDTVNGGWADVPGWSTRTVEQRGRGAVWVWAHQDRTAIEVALVDPDPRRSVWSGLPPAELLEQLADFEQALGSRWSCSGAITSDRWLRNHYKAAGGLRLAASDVVEAPVARNGPAVMRHWSRPPSPAERAGWCHAYDVNGMFLVAASSLALPIGRADHLDAAAVWDASTVQHMLAHPGWWRLADADTWIPTPALAELAAQRGVEHGQVAEAWVWPEHHRWLEPWYRAIRSARTTLPPGSIAARALKQVYTGGIGRLGSANRANPADPLYQPYWSHAVMAEANARLERKLHRIRDNHQHTPVALDVDCSWWITPEPDPATFAEQIGLQVDEQPGHFKHAGTHPVTPDLVHALLTPSANPLARLRAG